MDLFSKECHQQVVIDGVEAPFDVSFDIPPGSCPGFTDRGQGSVASSVWPETVGLLRKLWVVIGFQNGAYHFLYELI
jgi:hypothetical protein